MVANYMEFKIFAHAERDFEIGVPQGADNAIYIHLDQGIYLIGNDTADECLGVIEDLGLAPISFAEVMRYRVEAFNTVNEKERTRRMQLWWELPEEQTPGITTATNIFLHNNEITISEGDGPKTSFSYKELETLLERPLKKEEVHSHPLWLRLANNDSALLKEYVDATFSIYEKYGRTEGIGITFNEFSFYSDWHDEESAPNFSYEEPVVVPALALSPYQWNGPEPHKEFANGFGAYLGEDIKDTWAYFATNKIEESIGTKTIEKIVNALR